MKIFWSLCLFVACLSLTFLMGCGSGNSRQLQSITISPTSATPQNGSAQFTASAQFNMAPMTANPAAVFWNQSVPVIGLPAGDTVPYGLTSEPVTIGCIISGPVTITAVAPMDPNAPASGAMPAKVFDDLVHTHVVSQEAGFVAATAVLNCP